MTNTAPSISPRRRNRASDVPTTSLAQSAPIGEIDAAPRVLLRLPAIAAPSTAPATKPTAAMAITAIAPRPSPLARLQPWLTKLNTPRVKKYLPYALAVVIVFGVFLVVRHRSGKSQPVAADSDAPAWNNGASLPSSQASRATQTGASKTPNWATPSPGAAGASPSAYQSPSSNLGPGMAATTNPIPSTSYPSNGFPANGWPGAGSTPNGAAGGPSGIQGDSVPPMPARSPTWGNPPTGDPGVVQGGPTGPEYRTAQNVDPAAIPPGHGTNESADPGVARFQGFIARPPQQ